MKKLRRSGAKAASVPSQTQEEVDRVGTIEPYAIPRNCELIIAPNREKPRAASARSLTPFLEPRSLRGFFCVPSMIDSLEVEVLYPA